MTTKTTTTKKPVGKPAVAKPIAEKPQVKVKLEVGLKAKSGMWVIHGIEGDDYFVKPTSINEKALGIAVLKEDKVKALFGV